PERDPPSLARVASREPRQSSIHDWTTCWPHGRRQGGARAGPCTQPRAAWALDDTVPPSFAGYADAADGPLRLAGVANGSVLRPIPGRQEVVLGVSVQGARGQVWWMLNGRVRQQGAPSAPGKLARMHSGGYTLRAMDEQGRYDRGVVELAGVVP